MAFEDRTLTCKECGKEFVFSASEQEFYAEKGFQNDPARCFECRQARKRQRNNREMFDVLCAECGCETQFRSNQQKTVRFIAVTAIKKSANSRSINSLFTTL